MCLVHFNDFAAHLYFCTLMLNRGYASSVVTYVYLLSIPKEMSYLCS